MKTYDKLVRDRIPEIIEATGHRCRTRVLTEGEYSEYLRKKLQEEVHEFVSSGTPEELVDILEVVKALSEDLGLDIEKIEALRVAKEAERGGFRNRVLLEQVE